MRRKGSRFDASSTASGSRGQETRVHSLANVPQAPTRKRKECKLPVGFPCDRTRVQVRERRKRRAESRPRNRTSDQRTIGPDNPNQARKSKKRPFLSEAPSCRLLCGTCPLPAQRPSPASATPTPQNDSSVQTSMSAFALTARPRSDWDVLLYFRCTKAGLGQLGSGVLRDAVKRGAGEASRKELSVRM